jgi:hypothetical protein
VHAGRLNAISQYDHYCRCERLVPRQPELKKVEYTTL